MAGKPNKAGKSGKPSPAGKRGGRRPASAQQHPGEVLREILADTPPALAAKWFGLSTTELEAFYNGDLTPIIRSCRPFCEVRRRWLRVELGRHWRPSRPPPSS